MNGLDTELDAALEAMEGGFHVRLISTFAPDLVWAPADNDAASWLAANNPEFDQFPVKDGDRTVGVLLRDGNHRATSIRDAMHPLREGLIVSADMPITQLIPHVREHHFRLVLRGGRIDGLVTRSDLLKLPVRMLIFGLVSHLELCMRALVRQRSPWPAWLELLERRRRQDIHGRIDALSSARLEPDPLEFTNFSDMVDVLADQPDLGGGFRSEAEAIRDLRNDIAHAKTFISSAEDVAMFVERFAYLRSWIDRCSRLLNGAP
jgi:CBS domain-containing protein